METNEKILLAERLKRLLEKDDEQFVMDIKYSLVPRKLLREALNVYANYLRIFGQDHFPNDFAEALRMVELKGCDE